MGNAEQGSDIMSYEVQQYVIQDWVSWDLVVSVISWQTDLANCWHCPCLPLPQEQLCNIGENDKLDNYVKIPLACACWFM